MATPTHHWKIGLFVVLGFALTMVVVVFLGARALQADAVGYVTYFDESVQGLELGAPLKFRGVTVGTVTTITIAPDSRHVAVWSDIEKKELAALGFADGKKNVVPAHLRVQLASQGITGVKFLQIDFFDPKTPQPVLTFEVPERYIPAAVSTLQRVEDAVVTSVARLPEMTDAVARSANHLSRIMEGIEARDLAGDAEATLARLDKLLARLESDVAALDLPALGAQVRKSLTNLDASLVAANRILARFDGDKGLVASGQRMLDSFANVPSGELANELQETLRGMQEAAASVERLADALEREPDMLLKGRSRGARR